MKHQESVATATEPEHTAVIPAHIEPARRVTSASLLQGQRQIVIEHIGREYRLHLTSKGKLILTG